MSQENDSRQDLLLFRLNGQQKFGINVLKIKEIISLGDVNKLPESHPAVVGVSALRGRPLPVVDLSLAVGGRPLDRTGGQVPSIIVTEFNRIMQGFLVREVDRIVQMDWGQILPPPKAVGRGHYITGVLNVEDGLVEVIDVEKILHEVTPPQDPSDGIAPVLAQEHLDQLQGKLVLVVDDSSMARQQTAKTLDALGIEYLMAADGKEALSMLYELKEQGRQVDMLLSDIEMPEMDGYTLTREVRKTEGLSTTYVLLHTSLAGVISEAEAQASGANASLTKFVADELATAVIDGLTRSAEPEARYSDSGEIL